MPNSGNEVVQDHRILSEWSMAGPDNQSEPIQLPIDMRFNDGHRLSITVYRYVWHHFENSTREYAICCLQL